MCVCERECVCVRERVGGCVCVSFREREKEHLVLTLINCELARLATKHFSNLSTDYTSNVPISLWLHSWGQRHSLVDMIATFTHNLCCSPNISTVYLSGKFFPHHWLMPSGEQITSFGLCTMCLISPSLLQHTNKLVYLSTVSWDVCFM